MPPLAPIPPTVNKLRPFRLGEQLDLITCLNTEQSSPGGVYHTGGSPNVGLGERGYCHTAVLLPEFDSILTRKILEVTNLTLPQDNRFYDQAFYV